MSLAKLDSAARRVPSSAGLADDLVVLAMGSNPNPEDSVLYLNTERAVVCANTNRPNFAETFEMKRRMLRIALQEKIVFVR